MPPESLACVLEVHWLSQYEWVYAVWLAHRVFGYLAIYLMLCWSGPMLELMRLGHAYIAAGGGTLACGLWLLTWGVTLLKPSASFSALWEFTLQDLPQFQHFTMSILFIGAGTAEVRFGAAIRHNIDLAGALRWCHAVWGVCFVCVGLIFVAHPQHNLDETLRHIAMGTGIVIGAGALTVEKTEGKLDFDEAITEAPMLLTSAISFGVSTVLLLTFPMPQQAASQLSEVEAGRLHGLNTTVGSFSRTDDNASLLALRHVHTSSAMNKAVFEEAQQQSNATKDLVATVGIHGAAGPVSDPVLMWHRGVWVGCHQASHLITVVGLCIGIASFLGIVLPAAGLCSSTWLPRLLRRHPANQPCGNEGTHGHGRVNRERELAGLVSSRSHEIS